MYHETCYFSSDYEEELRTLEIPDQLAKMTKVVQFPYSQPVSNVPRQLIASLTIDTCVPGCGGEDRCRDCGGPRPAERARQAVARAASSSTG